MQKITLFVLIFFLVCMRICASVVIMDSDSGRVLYSRSKDSKMLIASTTKIMTAVVALENGNTSKIFTVGKEVLEVDGSSIYLEVGDKVSLNDLLHGLMLQSGNDAAMTIATNVLGYDKFIEEMNLKAYKLGMLNTTFENPHGLDEKTKNYSTAHDLALLMKYAIKNKKFMEITQTKKYIIGEKKWYNKNKLLSDYRFTTSGKIGYTKASGQVFVSSASKNGKNLIITSINEGDKFNLHKKLYEEYFDKYDRYKILDTHTFSFKVKNKDNSHYFIKNDVNMLLKESEIDDLKIKIRINKYDYKQGFVDVYLKGELITKEKIYSMKYNERKKSIKDLLLFWK
jgi:D-alanyl-D-alanine carboxypeptidase